MHYAGIGYKQMVSHICCV